MRSCTCPRECALHVPERPEVATGTAREGGARTVPVVDITQMVQDLYAEAEECRRRRQHAIALADSLARQADYLESIAHIFAGGGVKP